MPRFWPLVAALVAAGCPPPATTSCNIDDDCGQNQVCSLGTCVADAGEGEGAAEGEGEGALGEGEGAADGEGEGAAEGEGALGEGEGEGEGGGEGEGAGGEGEGEGQDASAPVIAPGAISLRLRNTEVATASFTLSDDDGDSVHAVISAVPIHGTVDANGGYRPDAGYVGADSYTLTAVDEHGRAGNSALVTIDVVAADWIDLGLSARVRATVLDTSVASVVDDVPVLVIVSDPAFVSAALDGVHAFDDDGGVLAFDFDHPIVNDVAVWVKKDHLDARAGTTDSFTVYAGGVTAIAPRPSSEVWTDYVAVYHLQGLSDASGNHADATVVGNATPVPCALGGCYAFDGSGAHLSLGSNLLDVASAAGVTLSANILANTPNLGGDAIAYTGNATGNARVFAALDAATGVPRGGVRVDDQALEAFDAGDPSANGVVLDVVVDVAGQVLNLYAGGTKLGTFALTDGGATLSPFASDAATIGSNGSGLFALNGRVDEVRASRIARSDDFVRVDAAARTLTLVSVGAVER